MRVLFILCLIIIISRVVINVFGGLITFVDHYTISNKIQIKNKLIYPRKTWPQISSIKLSIERRDPMWQKIARRLS